MDVIECALFEVSHGGVQYAGCAGAY